MKLLIKFMLMFSTCFFTLFLYDVKATTKAEMPYEVLNIKAGSTGFEISGWGFLAESQHYWSDATHAFTLILQDGSNIIRIPAQTTGINQTELMRVQGVRRCGNQEYNTSSDSCYYDYQNIGFKAIIPYYQLPMNKNYQVSLQVHAKIVNRITQIPLFFPTPAPFVHIQNEFEYRAISALSSTQLAVSYYGTFARPYPGDKKHFYYTNQLCSYSGGNKLYFEKDTIYRNIFESRNVANTTYYRLAGQLAGCVHNSRVIREGNSIAPVWIPSSFVEYSGKALTISTQINNHAPHITIHQNPIIDYREVDKFNPMIYVSAYDKEDGDLTRKIVSSGNISATPGVYEKKFSVKDKYGAIDTKIMYVTVTKPANTPPQIDAHDKTIYQYTDFDYLQDVTAKDREDGNLTNKVTYEGVVNTKRLGDYEVTYIVTDSELETTKRTINVHVIKNPREKIRYISVMKPWYKETIPMNWKDKAAIFYDQLQHRYQYASHSFRK